MGMICLLLVGSMVGLIFYIRHLHDQRDQLEADCAKVAKAGDTVLRWLAKNHPDIVKQMAKTDD